MMEEGGGRWGFVIGGGYQEVAMWGEFQGPSAGATTGRVVVHGSEPRQWRHG